jgi:hypothetical protein
VPMGPGSGICISSFVMAKAKDSINCLLLRASLGEALAEGPALVEDQARLEGLALK